MPLRSFRFRAGAAGTTVLVGDGALGAAAARLPRVAPGRWVAVSSPPVWALHGERLAASARGASLDPEPLLLPDGEGAKSWAALGALLEALVARGLKRDGGVVALGGGTVGDAAGLAASLALRGVPVVQVPTTLLAASDSALGGKTAVNLRSGKNLAGTFHQPAVVAVEPALLATLPDRDWRSGLAEVVKSALLDATFFRKMPALLPGLLGRDADATSEAVWRSLRMKARVVAADPDETRGLRFALNLGHTVAHGLEAASRHRLAHGEAVTWGLLAALELSEAVLRLPEEVASAARGWLASLSPPALRPAWRSGAAAFLATDKKADRLGLRVVLLAAPGRTRTRRVEAARLGEALNAALSRYNGRRHGVAPTAEDPYRHGPPRRLLRGGGPAPGALPLATDRDQP